MPRDGDHMPHSDTNLPLVETSIDIARLEFSAQQPILSELVHQLIDRKLVAENAVTAAILSNLDSFQTVTDMATTTLMSPRQLQRTLKKSTGFFLMTYLKSYDCSSHSNNTIWILTPINHTLFIRFGRSRDIHPHSTTESLMSDLYNTQATCSATIDPEFKTKKGRRT